MTVGSPHDEHGNGGRSGSLRDWISDSIAWEIETALIAIPVIVVAALVALFFDVSYTLVLVTGVVLVLVVRVAVSGWRRLTSTDPVEPRPPHEDL